MAGKDQRVSDGCMANRKEAPRSEERAAERSISAGDGRVCRASGSYKSNRLFFFFLKRRQQLHGFLCILPPSNPAFWHQGSAWKSSRAHLKERWERIKNTNNSCRPLFRWTFRSWRVGWRWNRKPSELDLDSVLFHDTPRSKVNTSFDRRWLRCDWSCRYGEYKHENPENRHSNH